MPVSRLVDRDPAAVEREWEGCSCDSRTRASRSIRPIRALSSSRRGVERLYGGAACARARARCGRLHLGLAHRRRRTSLHGSRGASVARRSDPDRGGAGRAGVPRAAAALAASHDLRPLRGARRARPAQARRARTAPGGAVAERLGVEGRKAWRLAHGGRRARVRGRRPAAELVEALAFPEAVANELTLRRALGSSSSACSRAQNGPGGRFETRAGRPARRRRLVAAGDHPSRRDGGAGAPACGARAQALGAPG